MNYSEKETSFIVEEYNKNPTRETVDELASKLNKTPKSIIGKLSREGVYRRSVYKTKTGETPITKEELVQLIAESIDLEIQAVAGLEKAPKAVLKRLLERINNESEGVGDYTT